MSRKNMDDHGVTARREDHHAVLECPVCRAQTRIREGEFDGINEFMAAHKACHQQP